MHSAKRLICVLLAVAAVGCAVGADGEADLSGPGAPVPLFPTGVQPPVQPAGQPLPPEVGRFVPLDARPVRSARRPPVPISGGTLLVTRDKTLAVAADPDRDRVSIVDLQQQTLSHTVALEPGDEPGRLVEDDVGRVHVALRGAGAVASIDLASGQVLARRAVCGAPRGIAFEPNARELRVACAGGELVSLPVDGGEPSARLRVAADLRDVMLRDNGDVFVSRFKRAELLRLPGGSAEQMTTTRPETLPMTFRDANGESATDTLEPEVAWRTLQNSDGSMLMLHQSTRSAEIALARPEGTGAAGTSAYGRRLDGCTSVVQSAFTVLDARGEPVRTVRFDGALPVDAVQLNASEIAIVLAGARDGDQPVASQVARDGNGNVQFIPEFAGEAQQSVAFFFFADRYNHGSCVAPVSIFNPSGQVIAIAATLDQVIVQTREPAALTFIAAIVGPSGAQIALGGESVYDTGHELFHRDAGAGVACASCHIEGSDDGHVWRFAGIGPRRTQSLNVGLRGTAPFHWSGDQMNIAALMEEVFVSRMGGVHQSPERSSALENYLYALHPPARQRGAGDPAALRGKALFEGEAECVTCHSGAKFTNNQTVDVGTGEPMQVPSLVGVGYRSPLIHTGCAATLRERFDPSCGGDKHGKTARLAAEQIDDLVAYLESI